LGFFYGVEDGFEAGAGLVAEGDQFAAGDEGLGVDLFFGHGFVFLAGVVVVVEGAVGGCGVHVVECEVLGEVVEAEEALQGGRLHVVDVAEAHVVFDEGDDLGGVFVGEAEAGEDLRRCGRRLRRGR
jgi:hypothetical protein